MRDKEVPPCHSNRSLHPHIINRLQVNEHAEHLPRLMETFRFRYLRPQQIILVIHPSRNTQPLEQQATLNNVTTDVLLMSHARYKPRQPLIS